MTARLVVSVLLFGGVTTVRAEDTGSSSPQGTGPIPFDETYQQSCELPSFQWADYASRLTGRMYTRRAAILGTSLYAAGYLKSTGAPDKEDFVESPEDFCVTGPYNERDPTGLFFSNVVCKDLTSYTTEHGSFAQYEVGVVKIDTATGEPQDIFVYYGEGQDETSGLATRELSDGSKVMAVSGHFVGSLTGDHTDGTKTTLYNSNAEGGSDFVLHPNAISNGFDDGFVISSDAETGDTNWMVAYPISNKDAQTVGVDIDGDGNIYGAGYACNRVVAFDEDSPVVCDGFVAKFDSSNGDVLWEQQFPELGAAMWIAYDDEDGSLYVTGTTSYIGAATEIATDTKKNTHCKHDICAVTMRLSASDGNTEWIRTTKGSPRWNFFDQTGDIEIANELDGPYVYVALDDVGEEGLVTLDEGTPYAACRNDVNGTVLPEYDVAGILTADNCPVGSTYIPRDSEDAIPAEEASTGANCGAGHASVDACIIKYNKHTGLPIWGADVHPVAGLVPEPDGKSIMVAGFYWHSDKNGHGYNFDSVELPDYNGIEGSYNAKLNAQTGQGEYVQHSGGVGKTRVYDVVGDSNGDVYMVGYTQSAVLQWGGTLQTKILEEGIDQNDDAGTAFQMGKVSSSTSEYQFFAVKLAARALESPSCVVSCEYNESGNVASPTIQDGHCLIDNVCYEAGTTAEIFGRPCQICKPSESQTQWSLGDSIGVDECFIDTVCIGRGESYSFRASRRETFVSECQICSPVEDATGWSVKSGFALVPDVEPPNDCLNITSAPTNAPTPFPTKPPVQPPVMTSTNGDNGMKDNSVAMTTDEIVDSGAFGIKQTAIGGLWVGCAIAVFLL